MRNYNQLYNDKSAKSSFSSRILICKEQSYILWKDDKNSEVLLGATCNKMQVVDDLIDLDEMTLGQGHDTS